jgi:hypothetical protein
MTIGVISDRMSNANRLQVQLFCGALSGAKELTRAETLHFVQGGRRAVVSDSVTRSREAGTGFCVRPALRPSKKYLRDTKLEKEAQ